MGSQNSTILLKSPKFLCRASLVEQFLLKSHELATVVSFMLYLFLSPLS